MVIATISTSPAVAEPETQPANGTSAAQARFTPAARDLAAIEERRAITLEVEKLMKNDAAPEQIAEWHEKNAGRLAANLRKLVEIAARKNSVPQPYIGGIQIPRGTSEMTKVFLMEGTRLNNEQAHLHNQPLQESPVNCGEALEVWQKQNAAALDAQASRASQISAESQPPTLRVPISASIPRGATSELRDFLTQRNAMIDSFSSVAIGSYNVGGGNPYSWVPTDSIFEIGNGVPIAPEGDDVDPYAATTGRSNALTVYKNGNMDVQGVVTCAPGGDIPMFTGN